jgi:hypothetical protein
MMQFLSTNPWLKDYQTLVAAILGLIGSLVAFSALLTGYLVNARLNRLQIDRNRRTEAASIAAVLGAEVNALGAISRTVASITQGLEKEGESRYLDPHLPLPQYFDSMKDKIGLLGPSLSMSVTNFYVLYLITIQRAPPLEADNSASSRPHHFAKVHFGTTSKAFTKLSKLADEVSPDLIGFAFGIYQPPKNVEEFLQVHSAP